ncbi:cytochrome P450 [Myriangium duriaei CBS 260.36]|uniref:Cytochrome P450 n=1 Tax=Myriangium duriaei CBS 260.36 TaxID=1168546 RepID=A0A9P4JAD5_9PEZI|nr:cytochrome P450 [Myriangium duriaei CBS 260.36]
METSYLLFQAPKALPFHIYIPIALGALVIGAVYSFLTRQRLLAGIPFVHLDGEGSKSSNDWIKDGKAVLSKGLDKFYGPFQVMTGTGPKIVLPNRYADELRNHPDLNFPKSVAKDLFASYPGFEALHASTKDDNFIQEVVRVKLTQSLGLVTNDLVEETASSMQLIFGDDPEFGVRRIKQDLLDLVSRMSSRVFLGKDLARNKRWLEISKDYTVDIFNAATELRAMSPLTRPFKHWLNPTCRRLRAAVRDAETLIQPEVDKRVERVRKAQEAGVKAPKVADTIGWMHEVARGRSMNYVHCQLSISLAAIHTTSETLTRAILDMCAHPEIVQPLREEVIQVLGKDGWAKTSLYKLKLMDSFLKESQRTSVMSWTSMNRYVERTITLKDGTVLPRGSRIMVSASSFNDPTVYPDPEKFDVCRFLAMRSRPGQENNWQFVTTSPDHMLFGHGQHACPGRFFASNEIKIALCHFLLKYDMKLVDGEERPQDLEFEGTSLVNPDGRIMMRRRQEEISLDL